MVDESTVSGMRIVNVWSLGAEPYRWLTPATIASTPVRFQAPRPCVPSTSVPPSTGSYTLYGVRVTGMFAPKRVQAPRFVVSVM